MKRKRDIPENIHNQTMVPLMVDYPSILKPSSLEDFLKKMADRPLPENVNREYLKGLGYTSSNEFNIAPCLKFIGFADSSNAPTELFRNFRDTGKSGSVMAQALKNSYKELFKSYANPCVATDADLGNFFRTATGRGGRMLAATVSVFRTFCKFGDFEAVGVPTTPQPTPTPAPTPTPGIQLPVTREGGGVTVNVNIRLELPATQDASVYDKIFESLKRHILASGSKTD